MVLEVEVQFVLALSTLYFATFDSARQLLNFEAAKFKVLHFCM